MKKYILILPLLISLQLFAQPCGTCIPLFSNSVSAPITDAVPTVSEIVVSGINKNIEDLNVYVNITHSSTIDFDITLTHLETGISTQLYVGVIDGCQNDINVTFDDEQANFLTCTGTTALGCYASIPLPGLGLFNGDNIDGTWVLNVHDKVALSTGVLNSWCLMPTLPKVECAINPSPVDTTLGACTNQSINLSWSAAATGVTPTGYKISVWHNNAAPVYIEQDVDLGLVTTYELSNPLIADTTYYWLITPYDAVEDASGCTPWTFITNPNADPIVDILSDSMAVCINDSVTLSSSISDGNLFVPGNYTIDWTGTDLSKLSSTVIMDTKFGSNVEDEQFTYYLTVTDDSLCQGIDSVIVYVKGFPDVGVVNADKDTICDGDQVALSIAGEDGTVSWNTSADAITYIPVGSSANPYTTSYNTGLYYMMAVVEKFNCYDTTNVIEIRVYDNPDKPLIDAPIVDFCEGDSVLLSVTNYSTNLLWNDGVTSTSTQYADASGAYNVTYTDAISSCFAISDDIVLNEIVVPKPLINATELTFCENNSSLLYCTNYANGLIWNDIDATQNDSLIVTESGDYKVYYTELTIGCTDSSEALTITKFALPSAPIITQSMDTLYSSISSNVVWYNDLDEEVGVGEFFKVAANGTYYAVYTDGNNCSAKSDDFVVTNVGINDTNAMLSPIMVYPNPSNGEIYIDNAVKSDITLLNAFGTVVLNIEVASNHHLIDVDIATGVYFLRITKEQKTITKRVIIE
jgi:subtilisin-like proprotein convertase family protein